MADVLRSTTPVLAAAGLLREALEAMARPRLAVSGGSAAAVLGLVRLTWVDERRVPFADPDSNRGEAYRLGHLDPGDPPDLELPLYLDDETPGEACARVEAALDRHFDGGLDVLLLGLGEDGHSASLFPGRHWPLERVHAVDASPKPPPGRMTLGLGLLAATPQAILVAAGAAKAPALRRLLQGDPALPAAGLRGLTVVTDLIAEEGESHG
jgi:6-phosphogluconolactonase